MRKRRVSAQRRDQLLETCFTNTKKALDTVTCFQQSEFSSIGWGISKGLYHSQALEIYETTSNANDPIFARLFNNLGAGYKELEKWEEARKYLTDAIRIGTEQLGHDHPVTKRALFHFDSIRSSSKQ